MLQGVHSVGIVLIICIKGRVKLIKNNLHKEFEKIFKNKIL